LARAQGRSVDAIKVARKWRNLTEAAGAVRDALRWSVRLTVLLQRAGDETGARRELHRANGIVATTGLTQLFAEERESLAPLLDTLAQAVPVAAAEEAAAKAVTPLPARPHKSTHVRMPEGSLSPREVEILTLVGDGLSNAEIGQRLSLVEGSVKWHLQRIYDKIGTRRRLVAVDRARRMGVFR
jgi:LuxR family maltose regulon positive regulatory protein